MYSVNGSKIELLRLRLLLLHRKSVTSFDDLRKLYNVQYSTFSDTCLALGFIKDDEEWSRAMQEAVRRMIPANIRQLFVGILIHCQPVHPEEFLRRFFKIIR